MHSNTARASAQSVRRMRATGRASAGLIRAAVMVATFVPILVCGCRDGGTRSANARPASSEPTDASGVCRSPSAASGDTPPATRTGTTSNMRHPLVGTWGSVTASEFGDIDQQITFRADGIVTVVLRDPHGPGEFRAEGPYTIRDGNLIAETIFPCAVSFRITDGRTLILTWTESGSTNKIVLNRK